MKKLLTVTLLVVLAIVLLGTVVNATTESELEKYLTSSHEVAGETVKLTSAEIKQVKDYFAENDITDAQATAIMSNINKVVAILEEAGTLDYTKLTSAQKAEILSYANTAAAEVGLTINTDNRTVTNAAGEVVFKASSNALVQTGTNYVPYIVVVGIAIIAIAGTVIIKKANA